MPTLHLVRPPAPSSSGDPNRPTPERDAHDRTGDAALLAMRQRLTEHPGDATVVVLGNHRATDHLDALGVPWTHRLTPPAGALRPLARPLRAIARDGACNAVRAHGPAADRALRALARATGLRPLGPEAARDLHTPTQRAIGREADRLLLPIDQPASAIDARRVVFVCGLMTVAGVPSRAVLHASASRILTARRFAIASDIPEPLITPDPPATLLDHADLLVSDAALVRDPGRHDPDGARALAALTGTPSCHGDDLDWAGLESPAPNARLPRLAGALLDLLQNETATP